jgi:hypothetical protein
MSTKRIAAIAAIFALASAGWAVLGSTTIMRTMQFQGQLGTEVQALWGKPLVQEAPTFSVEIPGSDQMRPVMPVRNEAKVDLRTDYRKKGLLWYPTYTCRFDGKYSIRNTDPVAQKVRIYFEFPCKTGTYDAFAVYVKDEQLLTPVDAAGGVNELMELAPDETAEFHVTYFTRGISHWLYRPAPQIGRVRDLNLQVTTDFYNVDYPDGCLSPMSAEKSEDGCFLLTWQASDLITQQNIGIQIPEKLNPGPLTSRITFFAPVCLLFFFILVATINILYKVNIHPMHYLFVAAGFFAFHLLMTYLAGVVNIHAAFLISAVVSVTLVTSYLSAALKGMLPWKIAAAGQVFYLVLFSYSFFLQGYTGLTVAIGSVVTLAILMKVTAHIDWNTVFTAKAEKGSSPALPPGLASTPIAAEQSEP